ncbi:MAG: hypothetical protein ACOC32_03230, partial [Nanoarchaeota archaeon]
TRPYFDTSWYLYQRFGKDEGSDADDFSDIEDRIIRWLLYNQNNDGSWGNASETATENLQATAMASIALARLNNGSFTEFIKDANIWISQNRPVDGWDTVKKDAISFLSFSRSAKPFIWTPGGMVVMNKNEQDVELYNPSSYDFNHLEFELEEHLAQYLEIDEIGSLASDYFKDIRLKLKENPEQSLFGHLSIYDDDYEIAKIPIVIQQVPEISFRLKKDFIAVYNGKGTATFEVTKTEGTVLDCDLRWDDPTITSKQKFKIDKQAAITTDIVFSEIANRERAYEGRFDCLHEGMNLSFPVTLKTMQFEDIPFTVSPEQINMTEFDDTLVFTIYNNVDIPISLDIAFESEDPYMMINQPGVQIPPLESKQIEISHFISENESVYWENVIEVTGYDRTEYVSLLVDYEAKRSLSSLLGTFMTFVIIFGVIGGLGFAAYTYRSQVVAALPDAVRSRLPSALVAAAGGGASPGDKNVHPMEKKVEAKNFVHLAEVVKIMKGLGQDDDAISDRLQSEGYSKGEINELFKRVAEEMEAEDSLEKEDKFMKLMKDLDSDVGAVRNKLKQDGFTDAEIKEAFKQAEDEILKKRETLDKKLKDQAKYDISKEDAEKAGASEGEQGDKKEGKKEEK